MGPRHGWAPIDPGDTRDLGMDGLWSWKGFRGPLGWMDFGQWWAHAWMVPRHELATMGPQDGYALSRDGPSAWIGAGHEWAHGPSG